MINTPIKNHLPALRGIMKCSHQVVHIALEQYALGSAYLKVTLCNDCPQVWIDSGLSVDRSVYRAYPSERYGHIRPATAAGLSFRQSRWLKRNRRCQDFEKTAAGVGISTVTILARLLGRINQAGESGYCVARHRR